MGGRARPAEDQGGIAGGQVGHAGARQPGAVGVDGEGHVDAGRAHRHRPVGGGTDDRLGAAAQRHRARATATDQRGDRGDGEPGERDLRAQAHTAEVEDTAL